MYRNYNNEFEVVILARVRDPKRDKAFDIYKEHSGNIDLIEIASQLSVPPGTIRGWKSKDRWEQKTNGTFHKVAERSNKNRKVNKKPIDDGTKDTMLNENLTHEQRLFCIYYSKSFNATQSYLKAYGCSYDTANVEGSRHLVNPSIRGEINRLKEIKRQQIVAGEEDMIEYHMRIAFADIGDYLTFGREEVPVMSAFGPVKDDDGNELTKEINTVKLKESNEVDTQLIQEVRQGKDGVSIKLADKQKSLDWLAKYFLVNPLDQHKVEYDKRKLEIELMKAEAEIKAFELDSPADNNNFLDALNATAKDVWTDEE